MKGVELIHLSFKTLWEEVGDTDDAGINFCPILPQNLQTIFFPMCRAAITGWRYDLSLLMKDEGSK